MCFTNVINILFIVIYFVLYNGHFRLSLDAFIWKVVILFLFRFNLLYMYNINSVINVTLYCSSCPPLTLCFGRNRPSGVFHFM
jgi:hypothetical protein